MTTEKSGSGVDQEGSTARTEASASNPLDGFPTTREELRAATALREAILYLYRGIDQFTMTPSEVWREMVQVLRDTSVIEGPYVRLIVTKRDTPFSTPGREPERLKLEGPFADVVKKVFAAGKPPKNGGRARE